MKTGARAVRNFGITLGVLGLVALSACSEKEVILPGERLDIREALDETATPEPVAPRSAQNRSEGISLPAAQSNASWTQRIGSTNARTLHPALSANPQVIWTANIGAGDARRARITADPVVADGRIFTMDSESRVTAVSTSGQVLWSQDLVPPTDKAKDATGGGLAYGDGKLFASTGFGILSALDPATGAEIWQQKLRETGSGTPAVRDGLVYIVGGDQTGWALDTDTGRVVWELTGTPDAKNVLGAPMPAVSDEYVVFSFGEGELRGAFRQGGLQMWNALLSGQRIGVARTNIDDVTGDPVIVGDTVYVGSYSGRLVALGLANGERKWTADEGALSAVWPVGGSLFLVSDRNELLRVDAETGERIWGAELPYFVNRKPKRQMRVYAHYGPVVAGGLVRVASDDGLLRSFNPEDGSLAGTSAIPAGATTNPVVAGGVLYVVNAKGQLLALR